MRAYLAHTTCPEAKIAAAMTPNISELQYGAPEIKLWAPLPLLRVPICV